MAGPTIKIRRDKSIRRIIDAAMEIFATVGYNGARIDTIAKKAGINKAMIYYRIGNKKKLYEAVIHDVYGNTAQRLRQDVSSKPSPEEKLKAFIADIAKILSDHPHFSRIMMREVVSGWTNFGETIVQDVSGTFKVIKGIMDEGVQKGAFIKTDPIVIHMMTVGTLLLYNLTIPIKDYFQSVLDQSGIATDNVNFDNIVPDVQRMMLAALKPEKEAVTG